MRRGEAAARTPEGAVERPDDQVERAARVGVLREFTALGGLADDLCDDSLLTVEERGGDGLGDLGVPCRLDEQVGDDL